MIAPEKNISLKNFTTFKIGGPADFFIETGSDTIDYYIAWAQDKDLPIFVLGGGSNVLFADSGFSGLIVKIKKENFTLASDGKLEVKAGASLLNVVQTTARREFADLINLAGVPGQLGGAIRGNAEANGTRISDSLDQCELIINDKKTTLSKKEMNFAYRTSRIKKEGGIILSATFRLKNHDPKASTLCQQILKSRLVSLPKKPSAGSFFKNIETSKIGTKKTKQILAELKKKGFQFEMRIGNIPAGVILESVGAKGLKVGDAAVSFRHANYLINTGQASSADVLKLAETLKQRVLSEYGIALVPEVAIVES